jgi:hypothetical protein
MANRQFVKNWNGCQIYYVPAAKKFIRCDMDAQRNEIVVKSGKTVESVCNIETSKNNT